MADTAASRLDELDNAIINLLRDDARMTVAAIAAKVKVSATAVSRRIARLEADGVIVRYTVVIDHAKVDPNSIEAYVEMEFDAEIDIKRFLDEIVRGNQEIREASMLAGHPDAIVRLRVPDIKQLSAAVLDLRKRAHVTRTTTLLALERKRHVST